MAQKNDNIDADTTARAAAVYINSRLPWLVVVLLLLIIIALMVYFYYEDMETVNSAWREYINSSCICPDVSGYFVR